MKHVIYKIGYFAERRAVLDLRNQGYTVVRSSRSLGPIDIVAINAERVRLIQVKNTRERIIPKYLEDIKLLKLIKKPIECSIELWVWKVRFGWNYIPVS